MRVSASKPIPETDKEDIGVEYTAEAACYLASRGHNGFPPCPLIDNASKTYVDDQDVAQQFLDSATERGDGVSAGELYNAYKAVV
jgi:hypothetical protein